MYDHISPRHSGRMLDYVIITQGVHVIVAAELGGPVRRVEGDRIVVLLLFVPVVVVIAEIPRLIEGVVEVGSVEQIVVVDPEVRSVV